MPDEDKNFGGSLVLGFRTWWRHMQIEVSYSHICPANFAITFSIKVAADPWRDSWVDLQTSFDNVITKFIVNNRTDAWKTDVNFFNIITNSQTVCSRLLCQHRS